MTTTNFFLINIISSFDDILKNSQWMQMTPLQIRKVISQTIRKDENKKTLSPFLWYNYDMLLQPEHWEELMIDHDDYLACDLPFVQLSANCLNRNIVLVPILQEDMEKLAKEKQENNITNEIPDLEEQIEEKSFLIIKANSPEINQAPLTMLYFPDGQFGPDAYFQSINRNYINKTILNKKMRNAFDIDSKSDTDEEECSDENDDFNTCKSRTSGNSFNQVTTLTPCNPASSVILNETEATQTIKLNRKKDSRTFHIAPGEGKIPGDWLRDQNFDIDAFPHLFADGKYGLYYDKRPKKNFTCKIFPTENFESK